MLEYKQYILGLYNDYFVDLRAKLETLMLNNTSLLLNFIESKRTLFNDIKDTKGINNNRWRMYLTAKRKLENEKLSLCAENLEQNFRKGSFLFYSSVQPTDIKADF